MGNRFDVDVGVARLVGQPIVLLVELGAIDKDPRPFCRKSFH